MEIDWQAAPKGAQYYAGEAFWKSGESIGVFYWYNDGKWHIETDGNEPNQYKDYAIRPKQWPETDDRTIATSRH